MAPQFSSRLAVRDATDENSSINPTIIAGIIVAAVIGAGAAIWLAIRWYRKRASAKRNARRESAFANFRGFDNASEKSPLPRCVVMSRLIARASLRVSCVNQCGL